MQEPLVSVVVPVHLMAGKLQNLEESLKVSSSLSLPIQFLLIHDYGDQETASELQILSDKYSAEYYEVKFHSPGLTRNHGLRFARAQWVTFWDSDDLGDPSVVFAAVSNAGRNSNVLIGGYKINYVKSRGTTELIKPERDLTKLMVNPGGWRFVFRKDFIGEVRYPSMLMGEDQVFLAKLMMQGKDIEYFDDCFYTYFKGFNHQLTMQRDSVYQIQTALIELKNIINEKDVIEKYLYTLNARMAFTALKCRGLSVANFIKYFFGGGELSWQKRKLWMFSFFTITKSVVSQSRLRKT